MVKPNQETSELDHRIKSTFSISHNITHPLCIYVCTYVPPPGGILVRFDLLYHLHRRHAYTSSSDLNLFSLRQSAVTDLPDWTGLWIKQAREADVSHHTILFSARRFVICRICSGIAMPCHAVPCWAAVEVIYKQTEAGNWWWHRTLAVGCR